jgi:glucose/arabinose dehydrogenase/mono/diheme cytochrome c family protein
MPHPRRWIVSAGIFLGTSLVNFLCAAPPQVISTDAAVIEQGRKLFLQDCSACHNFSQDGIGPRLNGITSRVSADWITQFIRQPQAVIESGDARAKELFEKYKVLMPAYDHYSDAELASLLAYLHTYRQPSKDSPAPEKKGLADPIPEPIPLSDLIVDMEPVAVIPPSSERRAFTRITKLAAHPITQELCVLDLRGRLHRLTDAGPVTYLDMAALMPAFINRPGHATGFGSFAFHPEFARNGLLYTAHSERPGSARADFAYESTIPVTLQWVLSEWRTDRPDAPSFAGTRRELLRIDMINQTHGMQEIAFNPGAQPGSADYGLLYVGIGDGGSAESRQLHLTQTPAKPWGTILRIDPLGRDSANGRYGLPPSNPFFQSATPGALGEVYAYGFRNPHRLSWTKDGRLITSDIGQHNIESLDLVLPGRNYGWPHREGTFVLKPTETFRAVHPLPENDASHGFTYPIAQYDHDEGNAVIGGFEYIGAALPELAGKYLFADMYNGRLFYIEMRDIRPGAQARVYEWRVRLNGVLISFKELCGSGRLSLRFGQDHQGELYLFAMPDGKIYRLVPPPK